MYFYDNALFAITSS